MAMYDAVLQAAERWLGYLEKASAMQLDSITANAGKNNYNIFAKTFKALWGEDYQAQPWCAVFVSVILRQACGKEIVPHFASCSIGINNFKAGRGGKWIISGPQRGDLIFFSDSAGIPAHVGFVSGVSGETVMTVEGNTSSESGVIPNGGSVCKKAYKLSNKRIIGYGRPAYEEEQDMTKDEVLAVLRAESPVYKTLADVPAWGRPTIEKLVGKKLLNGDGDKGLNLDESALRVLVVNDRAGLYQ